MVASVVVMLLGLARVLFKDNAFHFLPVQFMNASCVLEGLFTEYMEVLGTVLGSQLAWQLVGVELSAEECDADRFDLGSLHQELARLLLLPLAKLVSGKIRMLLALHRRGVVETADCCLNEGIAAICFDLIRAFVHRDHCLGPLRMPHLFTLRARLVTMAWHTLIHFPKIENLAFKLLGSEHTILA